MLMIKRDFSPSLKNRRTVSRRSLIVDTQLIIWVLIVFCVLAGLSIMRYRAYNAGMLDLGNMSQAIWSATQGRPLEFTYQLGNFSRLAFHVELFYYLLALPYALVPKPEILLVIQALLFVSAAFPLYHWARRRLVHRGAARMMVLIYLFYPVAQTAVLFDLHGDTLAMPLLIFALDALDRRTWLAYGFWLLLALTCKVYVAVAVAALGVVLWLRGERRVGWLTTLAGVGWGLVVFLIVRPAFAPGDYQPLEASASGYIDVYFGRIAELLLPGVFLPRLGMLVIVFGPALWLGWRAWRWLLPAMATALPALIAFGDVSAHDYRFHHYALAVPFLLAAVLDGTAKLRSPRSDAKDAYRSMAWLQEMRMQVVLVFVFAVFLVDIPCNPLFWLSPPGWGLHHLAYGSTPRDRFRDDWLEEVVPPDAPLMASFFIAPHVINRSYVYSPQAATEASLRARMDKVDLVVLDALFDYQSPVGMASSRFGSGHPVPVEGGVLFDLPAIKIALEDPLCGLIQARDGLLLFDCRGEIAGGEQHVERLPLRDTVEPLATFGDEIGLVDYQIVGQTDGWLTLQFNWVALKALADLPPRIAVTNFAGVDHSRSVHLPTMALYTTDRWQEDELVRETVAMMVPDLPNMQDLSLVVGWYDSSHFDAAQTRGEARIGEPYVLGTFALDVP